MNQAVATALSVLGELCRWLPTTTTCSVSIARSEIGIIFEAGLFSGLWSSGTAITTMRKVIQLIFSIRNPASVKLNTTAEMKSAILSLATFGFLQNKAMMLRYPVTIMAASNITPIHPRVTKISR